MRSSSRLILGYIIVVAFNGWNKHSPAYDAGTATSGTQGPGLVCCEQADLMEVWYVNLGTMYLAS